MKEPSPDYPFVAVQEALQSLTGAGAAMLLVCALGGAVPTVAGWNRISSAEDWILLTIAWIWHWAMAGLMVWGLLALLVPVWCFHELLNGNRSVHQVLAIAMITQLIVSTVAVCIFAYEDQRIRPIWLHDPGHSSVIVGFTPGRRGRRTPGWKDPVIRIMEASRFRGLPHRREWVGLFQAFNRQELRPDAAIPNLELSDFLAGLVGEELGFLGLCRR
jgi:hypothetical protein